MKRIVVNGTFDVLHPGHIHLLNYARSLGDFLYVLIDSDSRVRELKGPTRPVFDQNTRKLFLENLRAVDRVDIFNSREELVILLQEYRAHIMVKGSDYAGKSIIGLANCEQVVYFNRIEQYSTTDIIRRIQNQ